MLAMSPADKRLLPGGRVRGPTPWLIAIMMFVMVIVAAAGLAIANSASLLSDATAQRYTVQLPGDVEAGPALAEAARALRGVQDARAVPADEIRETLDRWLGPAAEEAGLPVPALVELDLAPDADETAIQIALAAQFDGAQLVANRASVAPLLRSLRALGWVAGFIVLLVALAGGAAVTLAARAALAANRQTIKVMHGVGATDGQVVRLFQRRIAIDALIGGSVGAAAAGVVLLLVAGGGMAIAGQLAGSALLRPVDILLLASLPFFGAALATLVARQAVLRALRQTP
ncbi:cell division protein FtsX [Sphingomicrobium marinum]|uniref:cell division protein FtsX n=1 Tax=Sphingomicrobium marinum TaxID=1227950 RepID=UPI002240557D|nr:cell division protein [Sphingomicrobium marinum]